jgi:tRNA (pseudouridine54-N1)-methyltransferase
VPRFVVVGQKATASGEFLPDDVPGTSGRLDVLLRCVRAALLCSHGMRSDVVIDLVLGGGPRAPRVLRIDGSAAKFIRPDERSLATLARKVLASHADDAAHGYVDAKPGIALARGGVDVVLTSLAPGAPAFVLEEGAPDLRDARDVEAEGAAFFVGDHLGFEPAVRERLHVHGAMPLGLGPTSVHAEDAIAIVLNEIDRRRAH